MEENDFYPGDENSYGESDLMQAAASDRIDFANLAEGLLVNYPYYATDDIAPTMYNPSVISFPVVAAMEDKVAELTREVNIIKYELEELKNNLLRSKEALTNQEHRKLTVV